MKRTAVIVGSGLAGIAGAESLRKQGFDGRITVVGEDPDLPYDPPPLTKAYMRGEATLDDITLHPRSFYEEQQIELVSSERVADLDVHNSSVRLEGGTSLRFDALLLATGATARPLPLAGAHLDGVRVLRTLRDADALRSAAAKADRVVVIGGGWIGSEVAASLRMLGNHVTIVAPETVLLERVLGREMGAFYTRVHEAHGVDLRLGVGVQELRGTHRIEQVTLGDGTVLDCDLVVAGIGAVPRAELAEAAGLHCDNGVVVDATLRASGSNVYAAGDVANAPHPRYGRLRVEHWANARDQGAAAARSMLGSSEPDVRTPYFYSDQYDVGMEYTGRAVPTDRLVIRGDVAAGEFIAFWLDGDRVTAGMNVNVWDVTADIERLVSSGMTVDEQLLADPSVPLSEIYPKECVA